METVWSRRDKEMRTGDLNPRNTVHRGPRYRTWYRGTDIRVTGLDGHGPRNRHWKTRDRLRWLQVMANPEICVVVPRKIRSEPVWPLARGATNAVVLVASGRQHRILYRAVGHWLGTSRSGGAEAWYWGTEGKEMNHLFIPPKSRSSSCRLRTKYFPNAKHKSSGPHLLVG